VQFSPLELEDNCRCFWRAGVGGLTGGWHSLEGVVSEMGLVDAGVFECCTSGIVVEFFLRFLRLAFSGDEDIEHEDGDVIEEDEDIDDK